MKTTHTIIAIALASILASCSTTQNKNELATWRPEINQPIQQLEEQLKALKQQQPMNYTISNLAFLYDVKLYIQFNKLLARTSGSKRSRLLSEQKEWLTQREKLTTKAYAEYQGGTMAPYNSARTFIVATKKRIKEINTLLGGLKNER